MSERGEATKRQILEAAVTLFSEGGFRALRISRVCERANISPTSVYWHFENKSGLVQAVLEETFRPIGETLAAETPTSSEQFVAALERLVLDQPMGSLTMLAYVADNLEDPDLEAAIAATRKRELGRQTDIIASTLSVDRETARRFGLLINACVNYAAIVRMSGGTRAEVRQVLNALKAHIP